VLDPVVRVGENRILVTVTSSNRLTTRTYVITAYVLMESISSAALSVLAIDNAAYELDPPFEPSTFKAGAVTRPFFSSTCAVFVS